MAALLQVMVCLALPVLSSSTGAPDAFLVLQIPIEDRGPAALPKTVVKRIAVSRHHPLMVATTSAGSVLLYDLRAPRSAVAQLKPHSSPMVRSLFSNISVHPSRL